MQYVIVKKADSSNILVATPSDSASNTHSGRKCNLKDVYDDVQEAYLDLQRISEFNPGGYYKVLPVIELSDDFLKSLDIIYGIDWRILSKEQLDSIINTVSSMIELNTRLNTRNGFENVKFK